jgi:hypothetical protein
LFAPTPSLKYVRWGGGTIFLAPIKKSMYLHLFPIDVGPHGVAHHIFRPICLRLEAVDILAEFRQLFEKSPGFWACVLANFSQQAFKVGKPTFESETKVDPLSKWGL